MRSISRLLIAIIAFCAFAGSATAGPVLFDPAPKQISLDLHFAALDQASPDASHGASSDNSPAVIPAAPDSGPAALGYLVLGNNYQYEDFGFMASTHPVGQGGLTLTWKDGTFTDIWGSSGAGGSASEIDLCGGHNGSIGPINYQAKACYYAMSLGKDRITDLRDDILYGHLNVGHTFHFDGLLHDLTETLYARVEVVDGVRQDPFQSVVRVIPISLGYKPTDWLTLNGDFGKVFCLTTKLDLVQGHPQRIGNCDSPYYGNVSGTVNVDDLLPTHGVTLTLRDKIGMVNREDSSIQLELDFKLN